jgi:hypothetical protein
MKAALAPSIEKVNVLGEVTSGTIGLKVNFPVCSPAAAAQRDRIAIS